MHDVPMGADMRVQVKALDKLRQEARGDHTTRSGPDASTRRAS
ncbi:hypothetical protein QE370_001614 [Aeromicrobium sp. SORGH_AS981]|nr:hypothetical protein [Aeromicrobium sp. SORGH_AS_0981]MDR6118430.1 hypothetical protein [Aeromicrobium sp. SORGH_AS_0981]